ncbi:hypothetical protein AMJ86_10575 [bacterium SM23_57]|nr:MAG: hypothetical protein AMJ86_10575 [bacterium SM23_57]
MVCNRIGTKFSIVPATSGTVTIIGLAFVLIIASSLWAMQLGPGTLDLSLTVAGALDDNVYYSKDNTKEAAEAQVSPGISYTLPVSSHRFSLGYQGSVITSDQEKANSLRQSPFGLLYFDFPGGLELKIRDRFTQVQDEKTPENEEIDGPDYIVNQAETVGMFTKSGIITAEAYYHNTIYRHETRAQDRDSDGHEAGGEIAVPVSSLVAILAVSQWGMEEVPERPVRNYQTYNITGGLRFSGPAGFDLDLTAGYHMSMIPPKKLNNHTQSGQTFPQRFSRLCESI